MAKNKSIKWKVDTYRPNGLMSVGYKRPWPSAENKETGFPIARIDCEDAYCANYGREEWPHKELKIYVALKHNHSFQWRLLNKRAATISEAKTLVDEFCAKYPDTMYGL